MQASREESISVGAIKLEITVFSNPEPEFCQPFRCGADCLLKVAAQYISPQSKQASGRVVDQDCMERDSFATR